MYVNVNIVCRFLSRYLEGTIASGSIASREPCVGSSQQVKIIPIAFAHNMALCQCKRDWSATSKRPRFLPPDLCFLPGSVTADFTDCHRSSYHTSFRRKKISFAYRGQKLPKQWRSHRGVAVRSRAFACPVDLISESRDRPVRQSF